MIRVTIDGERCCGHQMCVVGFPDVFRVGDNDEGKSEVLQELHPDGRLEDLLKAADSCPQQAIRIERYNSVTGVGSIVASAET
jgi:ferredoxin